MRSFSKKILLKIHRKLFRKRYAYLESILIRIIKNSEGKIENILNTNEKIDDPSFGKYILNIFDSPPPCSADVRIIIDRYTTGENWEYFWSKACFVLLSKLPLKKHYKELKSIIITEHLWYSIDALEALCTDPSFFKDVENIDFIRERLDSLPSWIITGWIHYFAKVKDDFINDLIHKEITDRLEESTQDSYLQVFYIIKDLVESGNPLGKEFHYYFWDIANSTEPETEEKYSYGFNFTPQLRARSLIRFMKLEPKNLNARIFHQNWLNTEQEPEIIAILNGKID